MQNKALFAKLGHMQKMTNTDKGVTVEQMFEAGTHYGYSKTRRHPSVSPFIFTTKNKGDIINLEKTKEMLGEAEEFAKSLGARGKVMLFVGTKPEAKEAVKKSAESVEMPYVDTRWIGGTISNFSEIKKRITELENYRKENAEGGLEKYTKKERTVLAKKMERLARYYSGLVGLKKIPDALFVIDSRAEHIAVTEAIKCNVPVIALANSDSNIKGINHPVIGNDASIPSINLFTSAIAEAYKKGQLSAPAKA